MTETEERAYDVFLSYSQVDKPAVETLARRLRDEDELRVFFDRWELVPGTHWQSALEEALRASRVCVVFIGSGSLGPWPSEEMRVALSQRVAAEPKRVIPVLLPGAEKEAVPGFLQQRTWVDFRAGLEDEVAYQRLVAGIQGVAPNAESLGADSGDKKKTMVAAPALGKQEDPAPNADPPVKRGSWVKNVSIALAVIGILVSLMAWVWPRSPSLPPGPELYSLRVQVLDPQGNPTNHSTLRISTGNEPQLLPDGWWEVEIPAAKVPEDGRVTVWAEHARWKAGRAKVSLGEDPNSQLEIHLQIPEEHILGSVVDTAGNTVGGVRITVQGHAAEPVLTNSDGKFELTVTAARDERVRLHAEHDEFRPKDTYCLAAASGCAVTLVRK